jgi:precorrin-3B synthase
LIERLADAGLIDASPEAEAVRNVLVTPFAGLDGGFDLRPLARAWEQALATDRDLWRLPGKFGVAFDAGLLPMGDDSDIRFEATAPHRHRERSEAIQGPPLERLAFDHGRAGLLRFARNDEAPDGPSFVARLGGAQRVLGPFPARDLLAVAQALTGAFLALADAPRRMRDAVWTDGLAPFAAATGLPLASAPQAPRARAADWLGVRPFGVGVAAPFGRLRASQLAALASETGLRLTPWRALLIPGPEDPVALAEAASRLGLIVDPADPILRVAACPGAPACSSALQETHETARRLSQFAPSGEGIWLHVSGCEKGCAHPRPAPLTAVATRDGYRLNGEPPRSPDALAERVGA